MLTFRILGWMGLVLIGLAGCETPRAQIKPPVAPEQFAGPPDETRYNGPVQYPPKTLNQTAIRRPTVEDGPQQMQGNFTGRPGMPGQPYQ